MDFEGVEYALFEQLYLVARRILQVVDAPR